MDRPPYLPILKWKVCEQKALVGLCSFCSNRVLPCIEVRNEEQNRSFSLALQRYWDKAALISYANPEGRLDGARCSRFLQTLDEVSHLGLPVYPVVNPADIVESIEPALLQTLVRAEHVYLRSNVDPSDSLLNDYLLFQEARSKLSRVKCSGIVDLGVTPDLDHEQNFSLGNFCESIYRLDLTNIYLASGSYPESLKSIGTGTGEVVRSDWQLWNRVASLISIPLGYSDYATYCPAWSEDKIPKKGPLAIRYTTENDWIIVRGGPDKDREAALELARIFMLNYKNRFEDADFSMGDRNIAAKADLNAPANSQFCQVGDHVWEALCHHLTYVVKKQYPL